MSLATQLSLMVIVFAAFLTEAVVGFGSTVLTVTLGAQLVPLSVLLPTFVPLNMLLSLSIVGRRHRDVDAPLLLRRVLPWVGAGTLAGIALSRVGNPAALMILFALFVLALSSTELYGALRQRPTPALGARWAAAMLLGAGVIHGLFGSGGPMVVYVMSREAMDKGRFRATLSALWLVLNLALLAGFLEQRAITASTLKSSATLLPMLLLGAVIGERVHGALPVRAFKIATCGVLLLAALVLLVRTLG